MSWQLTAGITLSSQSKPGERQLLINPETLQALEIGGRKDPAQLPSRFLCCNFTHISYADSSVCAEQTVSFSGKEERAKDELKVTQNQLNQFHVSGEVGMNFACVLDSKLEMSLPYLTRQSCHSSKPNLWCCSAVQSDRNQALVCQFSQPTGTGGKHFSDQRVDYYIYGNRNIRLL